MLNYYYVRILVYLSLSYISHIYKVRPHHKNLLNIEKFKAMVQSSKISIIIPAYNAENYINKVITSVL